MRDTCPKSGTICASVILCGSHEMSKLHVWMDQMMLGNLIVIGYFDIFMLTAGEPLMRKCEEAPKLDSVYFTRLNSWFVMNIVAGISRLVYIFIDDHFLPHLSTRFESSVACFFYCPSLCLCLLSNSSFTL